ncbi:MAG: aspartate dehydrogenase [Alphaproteobacteria bacterium]
MDTGKKTVGLAGFGAIGRVVGRRLDEGGIPGLELAAVAARNKAAANTHMEVYRRPVPVVELSEIATLADIVVECAPAAVFAEVAESAIQAGRTFIPASVGALLARPDLIELAEQTGARIIVPTGALLGLDAVRAAAEGVIHTASITTRKPPGGLAGAPYLVEHNIDLTGLTEPLLVFDGSAGEGAKGFPANVNVAAALSLAGIGPDRTQLRIWADPTLTRNTHHIEIDADSARFEMTIEGVPSVENPKTGRLTPLSVIATLRGLGATLRVGT